MRKSVKASTGRAAKPAQAHQVRIIGGQWKRTPLPVLTAEGLRPTTDRVRETVFNWLTHLLDNGWDNVRCLDLFAGSGALGLEAASRGARHVTLIDNYRAAIAHLEAAKQKLRAEQVTILAGDVLVLAKKLQPKEAASACFNVIFVDPPYHCGWLDKVMPLCADLLTEDGMVYVESEVPLTGQLLPSWMSGWEVLRADKAGMVFYHLLRRQVVAQNRA